jgi:hypothetical protein
MTFIGIVGARKYKDRRSVIDFVNELPVGVVVITGSCRGVCTWAGSAAKARGLEVRIFSPDLNNAQDKFEIVKRYYDRNRKLISACDIVHAFISSEGGFTGGTKYEVEYAKNLGKPVFLHWENSITERISQQKSLPFSNKELSTGWMNFFSYTLG